MTNSNYNLDPRESKAGIILQLFVQAYELNMKGNYKASIAVDSYNGWYTSGMTTRCYNTKNPVWPTLFEISYSGFGREELHVDIIRELKSNRLKVDSAHVYIKDIMKRGITEINLTKGGRLILTTEKKSMKKDANFSFQFHGIMLKNMKNGFLGFQILFTKYLDSKVPHLIILDGSLYIDLTSYLAD
eukprot:CAMPEP_0113330120 /NCGR_PEP_ID=MMETSP0010_2-20120614/21396_1 /TAXON_ID=216773 ORGANISM="Corethron hystrix, Strain 308" /NCGR_SAMPLE_ID=MMETSP0010_2 /ASSEMBLY_ACC=CAM_ASM_000155 /LENGTH=186 /DNA_ID=CAMNT_0000192519 /DNA_START=223 /DNA_END=784 /DNA_ORIENTATION=+ /assembly_acc=CAM_ASM_000155